MISSQNKKVWEKELPIWQKYYPKGDVVVDIGSDPESVEFFKQAGAKQVISIGDSGEIKSHISQGAIKIDIDGSEWGMIICTHGYKPKLKQLHKLRGLSFKQDERIYRLEKGRRTFDFAYKRFRVWLGARIH